MRIVTLEGNDRYIGAFSEINKLAWPNFLLEGSEPIPYCWPTIMSAFPFAQLILLDDMGNAIAVANAVPLQWSGIPEDLPSGWDDSVQRSIANLESNERINTLTALSVTISPQHMGKGLSSLLLTELKRVAERMGYSKMIVPVRPSLKSAYPLTPMERYITWKDENNDLFDPWLRTHIRLGGKLMRVCQQSMTVEAAIHRWESWAGMRFPESGQYIIPRALNPIELSIQGGMGTYVEPNVWVRHVLYQ